MTTELRNQFRVFSNSARPIAALMDDIDANIAISLRDANVRAKHVAIRSASVVLLSGFLESFLRQCAEAFFIELVRRGLRYDQLPSEMHKVHFVNGLDLALKRAGRKEEAAANFSETISALDRLASPPSKNVPRLVWEAFAVTKGNPGPDVIVGYLQNFGIKDGMRKIAAESNIDHSFLMTSLKSFILLRNECAHTGSTKSPPQPSDVRDFVHLLRRVTLGISKVLDKQLSELAATAPK